MAFIIDRYNKYEEFDRKHARYVFEINGVEYAIKEVQLKWGRPRLPISMDKEHDQEPYFIYETYEDAMKFVHTIKSLN